jgi:Fe-S cluster biogenesis protein NfuA
LKAIWRRLQVFDFTAGRLSGTLKTEGLAERGVNMKERVLAVLDEIRPALRADGGDVELVDISSDGVVKVKLTGHCGTCPFALMTLKGGIERVLKQEVPEVTKVVAEGLTEE